MPTHAHWRWVTEIGEDDDYSWLELGDEELLNPSHEAFALDWAVEHARGSNALVGQRGKEGQPLPRPARVALFGTDRVNVETGRKSELGEYLRCGAKINRKTSYETISAGVELP